MRLTRRPGRPPRGSCRPYGQQTAQNSRAASVGAPVRPDKPLKAPASASSSPSPAMATNKTRQFAQESPASTALDPVNDRRPKVTHVTGRPRRRTSPREASAGLFFSRRSRAAPRAGNQAMTSGLLNRTSSLSASKINMLRNHVAFMKAQPPLCLKMTPGIVARHRFSIRLTRVHTSRCFNSALSLAKLAISDSIIFVRNGILRRHVNVKPWMT